MNFVTSIKTCFVKYVDFNGRASRSEFWYFALFSTLLNICCTILDAYLSGQSFWSYDEFSGPFTSIFNVLMFLPSIAVASRRLHDTGRSGWWQLLYFTIIGIAPLIIWFSRSSQVDQNNYGHPSLTTHESTKGSGLPRWVKFFIIPIAGFLIGVLMLLGGLIAAGVVPDSKVVAGDELNSSVKISFINHKIVNENDDILYFYSTDMFSFVSEGQLLTQDGLTSYNLNEDGILQIWKMKYNEIDSIQLIQSGSFAQDSIYKIYGNSEADYDWIEIWLSAENNADKTFVNIIESESNL